MVDLTVETVLWCAHHGHPVLSLRTIAGDRHFAVAITAEDAGAMAIWRCGGATGQARFCDLFERTLTGLGARPTEVLLQVGPNAALGAILRVRGPQGGLELPVYFADGLVLAQRRSLPLRMAEEDLARVPVTPVAHSDRDEGVGQPPGPFRQLIESLDLDGIAGDDPARES